MSLYVEDGNAKRAEQIAMNFFQQHYSIFDMKTSFENGTWLVEAKTSVFSKSIKKLRIDTKTGKIIGVE